MSLLSGFEFGTTSKAALGPNDYIDSYGNVHHVSMPSLTQFTQPFSLSVGGSSSVSGSVSSGGSGSSFLSLANQVSNNNANVVANSTRNAATLALEAVKKLDPYVAERFYANLEKSFPGYRETFGKMTSNTNDMLSGRLPADVAAMVRMYSAEQNVQGTHAAEARNLGKTSLDMATAGFGQGATLFEIASKYLTPPVGDPYAMSNQIRQNLVDTGTLTPAQAIQAELANRELQLKATEVSQDYSLKSQQLQLQASQFNAQLEWSRTQDALNRAWAKEQAALLASDQAQQVAAKREENQLVNGYLKKYDDILSTLRGPSQPSTSGSAQSTFFDLDDWASW